MQLAVNDETEVTADSLEDDDDDDDDDEEDDGEEWMNDGGSMTEVNRTSVLTTRQVKFCPLIS